MQSFYNYVNEQETKVLDSKTLSTGTVVSLISKGKKFHVKVEYAALSKNSPAETVVTDHNNLSAAEKRFNKF